MNDLEELDDYLFGALPTELEEAFEASLFDRAAHADDELVRFVDQVGMWGRFVAARSGLTNNTTRVFVDSLIARGLKVEVIDAEPGQPFTPSWSEATEIAVTRFAFDMRGHTGPFEADIVTPDGQRVKTFRDVSYDPADGAFYAVCEAHLARLSAQLHCLVKLYELDGQERTHVGTVEQLPA